MADRAAFLAAIGDAFGTNGSGRFLIRDGGETVGAAEITSWGDAGACVQHIAIDDEKRRGRGVGTLFMAELSLIAARHGIDIHLQAFWRPDLDDGGGLVRWYSGLGFETDGEIDEEGYVEMVLTAPLPSPSP